MKAYAPASKSERKSLGKEKRRDPDTAPVDRAGSELQTEQTQQSADPVWGAMRGNVQGSAAGTLRGGSGLVVQRKMTLGDVGDHYEDEADRLAPKIVSQINAPGFGAQSQAAQSGYTPAIQLKAMRPSLQLKGGSTGGDVSPGIESGINRARGGGQPLAPKLQAEMGQAMGADFSGVRVHTDSQSDQLNQSIQAKAFTTGQDLFFKKGEYRPGVRDGQELIAHELTHVIQQAGSQTVNRKLLINKEEVKERPELDEFAELDQEQLDEVSALISSKTQMSEFATWQEAISVLKEDWKKIKGAKEEAAKPNSNNLFANMLKTKKLTVEEKKAKAVDAEKSAYKLLEAKDPSAAPRVVINYVWIGSQPLGAREKYNIYAWKARGDTVNLYTYKPSENGAAVWKAEELGLVEDAAQVHNIKDEVEIVGGDESKSKLSKRLRSCLEGLDTEFNKNTLFNAIDLTKTLVGGKIQGIVLDLKTGPSAHVDDYRTDFAEKFISYKRGGALENQSMGTMRNDTEGQSMRNNYLQSVETQLSDEGAFDWAVDQSKFFNAITVAHANAAKGLNKGSSIIFMDVSSTLKSREKLVDEPGAWKKIIGDTKWLQQEFVYESGKGPFRVLKYAKEQTNKGSDPSGYRTDNADVARIAKTSAESYTNASRHDSDNLWKRLMEEAAKAI